MCYLVIHICLNITMKFGKLSSRTYKTLNWTIVRSSCLKDAQSMLVYGVAAPGVASGGVCWVASTTTHAGQHLVTSMLTALDCPNST
uniref:Uncharacterized protein n=1 Tax=Arundo donax TaxID=35708 RepID=A0A0A9TFP9_ARUDO